MKLIHNFIRHLMNILGFRQSPQKITKLDIEEILQSYNKNVSYSYSHEFDSVKDTMIYSKIIDNLSDILSDNVPCPRTNDQGNHGNDSSDNSSESSVDDRNDIVSVSDLTTNFDYNMLSTINTSDEMTTDD